MSRHGCARCDHILHPMGVDIPPASLDAAVASYLVACDRLERDLVQLRATQRACARPKGAAEPHAQCPAAAPTTLMSSIVGGSFAVRYDAPLVNATLNTSLPKPSI